MKCGEYKQNKSEKVHLHSLLFIRVEKQIIIVEFSEIALAKIHFNFSESIQRKMHFLDWFCMVQIAASRLHWEVPTQVLCPALFQDERKQHTLAVLVSRRSR